MPISSSYAIRVIVVVYNARTPYASIFPVGNVAKPEFENKKKILKKYYLYIYKCVYVRGGTIICSEEGPRTWEENKRTCFPIE